MKATHLAPLLIVILLTAGCMGPIDDPLSGPEEARILVTLDMGTIILVDETLPIGIGGETTALDLLEQAADVQTAHDGGFVRSINGIASGHPHEQTDWFYHVNGRLASTGSADHPVSPDDVIVWDHRPWNHTMTLPYLLTGLPERPEPTEVHDPVQLAEKTDSPHIFLRVEGQELRILDAWGRATTTITAPWAVAHVIDDEGTPRLLLAASDPEATELTAELDTHPPTALGIVVTPHTQHTIPAPEP